MSQDYNYSVENDVTQQIVNLKQLIRQIRKSEIKHQFNNISRAGDTISINCQTLDPAEEAVLNDLVIGHVAEKTSYVTHESQIPISSSTTTSSVYFTITSYIYQGTANDLPIKRVLLYMDLNGDITSVSVKVLDVENSTSLGETTFSKNANGLYQFSTISGQPQLRSILEIQVKKNDGKNKDTVVVRAISVQK